MATYDNLIQVRDLKKYYDGENIKALDGVSVDINKGDVMVGAMHCPPRAAPAGGAHLRVHHL